MKRIKTFKFKISNYTYGIIDELVNEEPGRKEYHLENAKKLMTVEQIDQSINDWFMANGIDDFSLKSVFPITTMRHNNGRADWIELLYVFEY